MSKILIIPDSHAKPGVDNNRFTWLGNLIVEEKPDKIINLGDMWDMPSLCSYDYGKKQFEGRRYQHDIDAGVQANTKLFTPIQNYNRGRKKKYNPEFIITLGNHESRINKVIELEPKFEGTISIDDLKLKEFGWKVFPYKHIEMIEGIAFTHAFTSGIMDKPIGGINVARTILTKMHFSSVQGHQHIRSLAWDNTASGGEIFAYVAGCYFSHQEAYVTKRAQDAWWRGITILENVENGIVGDWKMISLKTIEKEYQ